MLLGAFLSRCSLSSAFTSIITPVIYSKNINRAARVTLASLGEVPPPLPCEPPPQPTVSAVLGSSPFLGRVGGSGRAGQGGYVSESSQTLDVNGPTLERCLQCCSNAFETWVNVILGAVSSSLPETWRKILKIVSLLGAWGQAKT